MRCLPFWLAGGYDDIHMSGVELELRAGSKVSKGVITPSAGAAVSIKVNDASQANFSIDYTKPDEIVLSVGGDYSLVPDRLSLGAVVRGDILSGTAGVGASIQWRIHKNVAASIETKYDSSSGVSGGLIVTIRFL